MSITPLDLASWGAICSGVTLVRSSMACTPREVSRLGSNHRRAAAMGWVLIVGGTMILLAVVVRHFTHGG